MASKYNPKGRENDIVLQQLKDEVLIYDITINKAYCLNKTSALVWNLCDGNNSISDISGQLSKKLKQPVTDDLVWLALDQLKKDNLLVNNEEVQIKFDGLSRREVIRKVGLASMIALPVISSLIAPHAANAASGVCNWTLGCQGPGTQVCPNGCEGTKITYRNCGTSNGTCGSCPTPTASYTCVLPTYNTGADFILVSIP